jgi:lysyl-tRNA synthetase class 1
VGKLPWRVDWPARWKMLGVTFEPFGKDLGTVGGARQTGEKIVEEVYGYPALKYTVYEFILLKGKGAMHSSKGTALSAEEMLHMTPPEVLRFLIMKNQPNKHIVFDPGLGVLNLVDDYDQKERMYFGVEEKIRGIKDLEKIYELSQPYDIPQKIPYQVPYRHLVTVVQIAENWEEMKQILVRTDQIPSGLNERDERHLSQRARHAQYWLTHFAPEDIRFEIKKEPVKLKLGEERKNLIHLLVETFRSVEWKPQIIHDSIYEISERGHIPAKTTFQLIYQIILGKKKGPRVGYFLSNLERDFVVTRMEEAIK